MAEVFSMDSSLSRHTLYVDNCGGSLERTRQTNVDAILLDLDSSVATQVS